MMYEGTSNPEKGTPKVESPSVETAGVNRETLEGRVGEVRFLIRPVMSGLANPKERVVPSMAYQAWLAK